MSIDLGTRLADRLGGLPDRVRQWAEQMQAVGLVVAVLAGDEELVIPYGCANVDTAEPVTEATRFQIGSNAKLWTATLAMQLVDRGLIDLGAPVRDYVPEFTLGQAAPEVVTVRHLLTHTGGFLGDYFGDPSATKPADVVRGLAQVEQLHPVGAAWSYCNSGYVLLGHLIERVTGKDYEQALRELLLDPLDDTTTCTLATPGPGVALGHEIDPATSAHRTLPLNIAPACAPAGSTTISTAHDVLRFIRMHINGGLTAGGVRILSAESAAMMQSLQVAVPELSLPTYGWGLGWALRRSADGQSVIGHGGATPSMHVATLEVMPERQLAVVVLANSASGGAVGQFVADDVFTSLADTVLNVTTDPNFTGARGSEAPIEIDPESYCGRYVAGGTEIVVEPGAQSTAPLFVRLTAASIGPATMAPQQFPIAPVTREMFAPAVPGARPALQFLDLAGDGGFTHVFAGRLYPRQS